MNLHGLIVTLITVIDTFLFKLTSAGVCGEHCNNSI